MGAQRDLARLLASLNRTPTGLSAPQVKYSSIEDGALQEFDAGGNLASIVGQQWDGSHGAYPVTGPVPPRPTAPTTTGGVSATISWDGLFLDGNGLADLLITAPMDWSRVEIHVSKVKGFRADTADTLVDTIETPRGGSRPVLPGPGTWYAVLVARSLAGKRGEQSPETEFEIVPGLSEADVQALRDEFGELSDELNEAVAQNLASQAELAGAVETLQDVTLPALEEELGDANTRLGQLTGPGPMPKGYAEHLAASTSAFIKADIGNLVVTGDAQLNTLTAQRIAANVANFLSITTDQLVAGTATLGEAVARKIAAETGSFLKLTANQVFIGEAGNMERDPNFDQLDGWYPDNIPPTIYRHAGGGYNGATAMSFPLPLDPTKISGAWRYNPDGRFSFPVVAGEKYRISCWVQSDKDMPIQSAVMHVRASTPTGGFWGVPVAESAQNKVPMLAGQWYKITETVTIPANATSAFLGFFRFSRAAAATIRFSTPTVQQAITPSLIVDGFFQGLRVIGASVETNETPETGVKMNDKGMTAYGKSNVNFAGVSKAYKVRANVDSRINQWGANATASLPGFWLESEPADGSSLAPQFPAGVTLTDHNARALRARSAMASILDPYSELMVSPTEAKLETYMAGTVAGQARGAVTGLSITGDQFNLGSVNGASENQAQVKHGGDGVLHLNAKNGVKVNGATVGGSGSSPLVVASLMVTDQASIANNDVAIKFNTTVGDYLMWGGTSQPTRLYAMTAGLYFVSGNVIFSNMGGGMRGVWFRVNGAQRLRGQSNPPPSADQYAEIDAHNYINLKAGDYVEIMATVAGAAGAVWIMASQGTSGALEFKRP